jgi:hypothetical protein
MDRSHSATYSNKTATLASILRVPYSFSKAMFVSENT